MQKRMIPDLVKLGIMKRRLTRDESREITKNIMKTKIKDTDVRVGLAIMKAIEVTQNDK